MNGFDYFVDELDTDFLRYIFGQMRAVGEEYGLDCLGISVGEGCDITATVGCQGIQIGMLCYLNNQWGYSSHQWGYSFDKEDMLLAPTPEHGAYCLMLEHAENGGAIGGIAA